jgi:hypothetical protein
MCRGGKQKPLKDRETVDPLVIRCEETSEGENDSDKDEEAADERKRRKR